MHFYPIFAVFPCVLLVASCKPRAYSTHSNENSFSNGAGQTTVTWPFTFQAQDAIYHGFSWTSQAVPENGGARFLAQSSTMSHEENAKMGGRFNSNMAGGYGVYFAQDPFVSYSYGDTLIAVTLKTGASSAMAHASDADYDGGQEKHFIPALLSRAPLFHYFWRYGNAFVLRDASSVMKVDVFGKQPAKRFSELPSVETITLENLPQFLKTFGPWVRVFSAAMDDIIDYRTWTPSEPLSEQQIRLLAASEINKGEVASYAQIQNLTTQQVQAFATAETKQKAEKIFSAMMRFRQTQNQNWSKTWRETSTDPRIPCKNLVMTANEKTPLYAYSYEEMDSPRARSIQFRAGTHKAVVKSRNGDVVTIATENGQEGMTYLSDWTCDQSR